MFSIAWAAAFFGAGAPLDGRLGSVLVSLLIGALLGLSSQRLAALLGRKPASSA